MTPLKDLIQSEKELSRPSQEEAGFKALAGDDSPSCATCRWFKSVGGDYCHLIQNAPLDVSEKSVCDRHEEATIVAIEETVEKALSYRGGEIVDVPDDQLTPEEHDLHAGATIGGDETTVTVTDRTGRGFKDAILTKLGVFLRRKNERDTEPEVSGFKAYDNNRWVAWWTNNFQDREGEILTAKAIDDYIARVDAGIVPYPELRAWHIPGSRHGQADFLARIGHFALASGTFDDTDMGRAAQKQYARSRKRYQMSHGFLYNPRFVETRKEGRVYHRFNTFELTTIPATAKRFRAANPYTEFPGVIDMLSNLTTEKQQYLEELFGKDIAEQIVQQTLAKSKAIEDLGVAFKDYTAPGDALADADAAASVETPDPEVQAAQKALWLDIIADSARLAELQQAAARKQAAEKDAFDARFNDLADLNAQYKARLDEQAADIAALKEQLDSRPKQASKADETTLDVARLEAISKHADSQTLIRDSFFGTEYPAYPASTLNGA